METRVHQAAARVHSTDGTSAADRRAVVRGATP
jgi:hypothetical protein